MKRLTKIKPYSDEKLEWNDTTQRYYLTFEFVKEFYPDVFADDKILKDRIKKNTNTIYRFIRYRVNSYNINLVEGLLAKTQEGRDFIFELLKTQFEADVESGFNDLQNAPAVNLANGSAIDRNEFWKNQVSVPTEQEFDSSVRYFGINIAYQGIFPSSYYLVLR